MVSYRSWLITLYFIRGKVMILRIFLVYVDDMIFTCSNFNEMEKLRICLSKEFEKDLGSLKYFGIEASRSKHGLFLSQRKYSLDLHMISPI